ncbi:MAG: hypothetical protein E6K18_00960 [Methanobacteriota archaeon]|nr:MAG: hypothetical protein E6K18_00960 [Euryarchaeota archaeon]
MMAQDLRGRDDANLIALRRWLEGHDEALEDWLGGRVSPIRRRRRTLAPRRSDKPLSRSASVIASPWRLRRPSL